MCQALLEIMESHLLLREKEGMEEGIKDGIKEGIKEGIKRGINEGINGTVDTLRAFGHGDLEIKNAIMQRYALSEEAAEGYLYQKS